MTEQPTALRLATVLENKLGGAADEDIERAAAELRRLHDKVQLLRGAVEAEQNYIATMRDLANANEKLHAANQELLEALGNIATAYRETVNSEFATHGNPDPGGTDDCYIAARTAIAKHGGAA